jgi:hypothetical protein
LVYKYFFSVKSWKQKKNIGKSVASTEKDSFFIFNLLYIFIKEKFGFYYEQVNVKDDPKKNLYSKIYILYNIILFEQRHTDYGTEDILNFSFSNK